MAHKRPAAPDVKKTGAHNMATYDPGARTGTVTNTAPAAGTLAD